MNEPVFPAMGAEGALWEIECGSRLHFGLFSTGPGGKGDHRFFGGMGLMIEEPSLVLRAKPAREWPPVQGMVPRVFEFRERIRAKLPGLVPMTIEEVRTIPAHFGLGSGTQKGLAVAALMCAVAGLPQDLVGLCGLSGRGLRSAIGSHGFVLGGFLVDAGRMPGNESGLGALAVRQDFPEEWLIVLARAGSQPGMSGKPEQGVFDALGNPTEEDHRRDRLCRIALLGVLPALIQKDHASFGQALGEFNQVAGEPFAAWQGGDHMRGSAPWLEFCRREKVFGVGQSSWGPTLFAVASGWDQAQYLEKAWVEKGFGTTDQIRIVKARNQGAKLRTI